MMEPVSSDTATTEVGRGEGMGGGGSLMLALTQAFCVGVVLPVEDLVALRDASGFFPRSRYLFLLAFVSSSS